MKILLIIVCVVVILIAGIFSTNFLYLKTNHSKNFFQNSDKFVEGVPKKITLAVTGSSYAKFDFDFTLYGNDKFNFGIMPQSLNYDYKILQQYEKHMLEDCVVLITLAPLVFCFMDYEDDVSNYKYYKFLKAKYINNYSLKTHITHIIFPLLATPRLVRYIKKDVKKCDMMKNMFIDDEHTKKEADIRETGWCQQFGFENLKNAEVKEALLPVLEETEELLERIISFCYSKKWHPILVIPPVSLELRERFSDEFLEMYFYKNISKTGKKADEIFDYWKDEELGQNKLYFNSDFMNEEGRKLFTQRIMEDVRNFRKDGKSL